MRWLLYILILSLILMPLVNATKGLDNDWITDDDWYNTYEHCSLSEKQCIHKDVFPLEVMEFFGSVVLGLMIALSNAGGIGGGGIIVPIAIIFFRFRTKQAVAISNFCIFTASVVRFSINYNKKHPQKDAKVIDYSIIMIMLPMVLLGSLFGVQINMIIPESLLLGGLTLILAFLSVNSLMTSFKIRKRENLKKESKVEDESQIQKSEDDVENHQSRSEKSEREVKETARNEKSEEDESKVEWNHNDSKLNEANQNIMPPIYYQENESKLREKDPQDKSRKHSTSKDPGSTDDSKNGNIVKCDDSDNSKEENTNDVHPELEKIIQKERTHLKPSTLILFPSLFIVLIFLILLRGTSSVDSIIGVESCSALSYVILVVLVLFYSGMTVFNTILVKREYKIKLDHGYNFIEGDLKWEPKLLIQFIGWAFGAGLIAGTVGLGGGVIFSPLLLSFKVPPQVASATGMFMITFGSLSNIFLFTMADYLHFGFGFWWGAYTAVGTAVGIILVNKLISKTGRTSYLAFILTSVIIISAIIIPIYGTLQLIQDSNDGKNLLEFGSLWD